MGRVWLRHLRSVCIYIYYQQLGESIAEMISIFDIMDVVALTIMVHELARTFFHVT